MSSDRPYIVVGPSDVLVIDGAAFGVETKADAEAFTEVLNRVLPGRSILLVGRRDEA